MKHKFPFHTLRSLLLAVLCLGLLAGCGGSGDNNDFITETLTISPVSGRLAPGNTLQFNAVKLNQDGSTSDVTSQVAWSCDNAAAGAINPAGLFTAAATGTFPQTAHITATKDSLSSNQANLSVTQRQSEKIAAGDNHSLKLKDSDGTVWSWGLNTSGQLGDGTGINRTTPVQVLYLSNIVAVACGWNHCLALDNNGLVWAWGNNAFGQLGDGTFANKNSPVQVWGLTDIIAIAGGGNHSLALDSNGLVWAWGSNTSGQLGDGSFSTRQTPVRVANLTNVTAIAGGGSHSLALDGDNLVWAWGSNTFGQLGTGNNMLQRLPVAVLTDGDAVAAGDDHSLALDSNAMVWSWGLNSSGQLGDGSVINKNYPVQVQGALITVKAIAAGGNHSLAFKTDATAWSWGSNTNGQLGDNSFNLWSNLPVQVLTLTNVNALEGGGAHSLATLDLAPPAATLFSWGHNQAGQLGDGTIIDKRLPVQVVNF